MLITLFISPELPGFVDGRFHLADECEAVWPGMRDTCSINSSTVCHPLSWMVSWCCPTTGSPLGNFVDKSVHSCVEYVLSTMFFLWLDDDWGLVPVD